MLRDSKGKDLERSVRVLLVSALPPPTGGVGSWTQVVVEQGLLDGHEVHLVDTSIRNERRIRGGSRWAGEGRRTARIIGSLVWGLMRVRPDVVHLNCYHGVRGISRALLCARLARLWSVPVVSHYHGETSTFLNGRRSGLRWRLLRALVRTSQANIAMNQPSLECLRELQPGERPTSVLLPNFIEDSVFDSHSLQTRRQSERPQVLYAGRIMVNKGCREVLAAARQLPGVDFTLLGPVMAEMEQYLQDLPPNVILGGDVSRDAVLQKMRESDIFVLFTTHSEGFPMVVVEAMAVGLPVVSTRVGAIPEMIEEGSGGLLVDAHDTAGLVTALRTLAEDPAMRAVWVCLISIRAGLSMHIQWLRANWYLCTNG